MNGPIFNQHEVVEYQVSAYYSGGPYHPTVAFVDMKEDFSLTKNGHHRGVPYLLAFDKDTVEESPILQAKTECLYAVLELLDGDNYIKEEIRELEYEIEENYSNCFFLWEDNKHLSKIPATPFTMDELTTQLNNQIKK